MTKLAKICLRNAPNRSLCVDRMRLPGLVWGIERPNDAGRRTLRKKFYPYIIRGYSTANIPHSGTTTRLLATKHALSIQSQSFPNL